MNNQWQSPPTTAALDNEERVYKAVKDFELLVMQPPVEAASIFMGNDNDMALPAGSNEFVVNTVLSHVTHGTPIVRYELNEDGIYEAAVYSLEELTVQVDAYSDDPTTARMRAQCIATIAGTTPGVDFMYGRGISSLYTDDPRETTVVMDSQKYVHRWTTTLHLSYVHRMRLGVEGIAAVNVDVQNVDVKYPSKE